VSKRLRLGVVFGGKSGEHEVSARSAASVIEALDQKKYEVLPIAISPEGKWLSPAEAATLLSKGAQALLSSRIAASPRQDVAILPDPTQSGLISFDKRGPGNSQPLDVVFPVLHGPFGEDGTIQGLFEMANIPYVGGGVLASACGMDKVVMKSLFLQAELPLCRYTWFLRQHWEDDAQAVTRKVARELGWPVFVKPANLGSSVGISKATDKTSFKRSVELAAQYDRKIIVEESIDAREIECGVLGNDEPTASLPGEYVVHDQSASFLDYTEKYSQTGHVEFVVPAPVSKSISTSIQKLAVRAFRAIDGAGLSRVDFFLERKGKRLLVNEINTMPGLTDVSGYPKMWAASGLSYTAMLDRLIELALEKHRDKARNKTTLN